ncbi:3-hydroxylacyl-ACP dehydratase [Catenovulum agarivorans DS-2]|uniref:3-hydroxylacyl-ACP dehydratase n=1 Tax=Catenovulum agarivorans DS-2 TaxID=1328313 RepID=W7QNS6_9ALTE|nr:hotdog family protein [Catenovulum agarivorans]EWH10607.1 3-hydroxylacyl-ACP dehydratase [Catenovulum agarivorans DS-2]
MAKYAIEEVVPHDHPMILLDSIESYTDNTAVCQVKITPDVNFYDTQLAGVPAYVGVEYMAQSIAAFANANERDQGKEVALGFLVSSRKYKAIQPSFKLDELLTVQVERLYKEDNGLSVFDCQILVDEQVRVEATINVFQPDEPEAFIKEQTQ